MRLAGIGEHMGEKRNSHIFVVGKPERNAILEDLGSNIISSLCSCVQLFATLSPPKLYIQHCPLFSQS